MTTNVTAKRRDGDMSLRDAEATISGWRYQPAATCGMRTVRGYLWMLRTQGLRTTLLWWRARRAGYVVDYAAIFTPEELALLGEHAVPAPWERAA